MIKTETARSIGLKKTLVFYSGKAPKGIRTSWIMNEYRLPHHETEKYQKAEISLCRVYKRAGVEDHPSLPRSLPSRASSSRGPQSDKKSAHTHLANMERFHPYAAVGQSHHHHHQPQLEIEKISTETDGSCSSSDVTTALGLSKTNVYNPNPVSVPVPVVATSSTTTSSIGLIQPTIELEEEIFLNQSRQVCSSLIPNHTNLFTPGGSSPNPVDDLHRLVNYQQVCINNHHQQQYYSTHHHQQQQQQPSQFSIMSPQVQQSLAFNVLPNSLPTTAFSERLWEWNIPMPEASRDQYNVDSPFK